MKVADRLGPKGNAGGSRGLTSSARGPHAGRSTCRCLRSHTSEAETSKPRIPACAGESPIFPPQPQESLKTQGWARVVPARSSQRGKPNEREAQGGAGVGPWRKRMPSCNGADTGSEFARRESELTSYGGASLRKSMKNRLKQGKQWDAEASVDRMCTLSSAGRSLTALGRVSQSSLDLENMPEKDPAGRVGVNRPLRRLSRVLGNSHARFLEGCGGGNAPVPTRRANPQEG